MIDCDANAIALASKCYCGFSKTESDAAAIYSLCYWATHLEACQVSWTPDTALAIWTDSGGVHVGANLATFLATADLATVTSFTMDSSDITSLTCLESMPMISNLSIGGNPLLPSIDISGLPNLTILGVSNSAFFTLDTSNNPALLLIDASNSPNLASLDLSSNLNLQFLSCNNCNMTGTLDLSGLTNLTFVNCSSNPNLTALTLTGCTMLTAIDCSICALNQAAVDNVLCTTDTNGAINGTLDITTNVAPGAAGLICSGNLDPGKGWTVSHD